MESHTNTMVFVVFLRQNPESVYWMGIQVLGVFETHELARARIKKILGLDPDSVFVCEQEVQREGDYF